MVALALALATLPFMAASANAAVTSIENDADQDGLTTDWQGLVGGDPNFTLIQDPVGNADTTTFNNSESDYPDWQAGSDGTASGKSDIGNVYVYDYRDASGDVIVALAWDRAGDTGTGRYYVELNQLANQGLVPVRTVGDVRVTIGINGSDDLVCQRIETWDGDDWSNPTTCDSIPVNVNSDPITDYFNSPNDDPPGTLEGNTFVETVINLTDFGATTCPVSGFASLAIRSQEGNEGGDTSALKDRAIGNVDIDSDCGEIKIEKRDFVTGELVTVAGSKFSIVPDPTAGSSDAGPKTVVDNNTTPADLTDTNPAVGQITIANVEPDDYTVTEIAAPAGYFLPPPGCDAGDGDRCTTKTVGIGESVTFTFKDKRAFDAPTIDKNVAALYDASYAWDIEKTVADADEAPGSSASQNVPEGTDGTFDYAVKVTEGAQTKSNFRVSGTVTLGNSNDLPMTVTLSDVLSDNTVCSFPDATDVSGDAGLQVSLPADDDSITYDYTCSPGNNAQNGINTATVKWDRSVYPQTQAQVDNPPAELGSASANANYTFEVDDETNKTVTITDDHHEFVPPWVNTWGDGPNPETRTYTKDFPGVPGTCTDYDNTATITETQQDDSATATVCVGKDLVVTKNKIASLKRTFAFDIEKSVEDSTLDVDEQTGKATANYSVEVTDGAATDSDWVMSGTIFVSNPNDWQNVTLTGISDAYNGDSASCEVDTTGGMAINASQANKQFPYTCLFDDKPLYNGNNVATITWNATTAATPTGTDTGSVPVVEADWSVTEIDKTVSIIDDKTVPGAEHPLGDVTWQSEGTVHTPFTYSLELDGVPGRCVDYTNTATIVETGQNDDATVTVCAPLDVAVEKTASGTYDRKYLWEIAKAADETTVTIDEGSADFHYTVTATPDGYVDSGWTMGGQITVTNPNDFKTMTVDITDVPNVGGGADCDVTNGTDVLIPMATLDGQDVVPGSATRDYVCTFTSEPLYQGGTNTAVATWEDGSASSLPTAVPFSLDEETDKEITVTDDKVDLDTPEVLGTANWFDGPSEFKYTLTQEGVTGECTDYTNTALIEETGQDADETVTLCVQSPLSISKTVEATYDRTYLWQIDKVADKHFVEIAEGGTANFHYDVTVGPATSDQDPGFRDSGWEMTGTITVTNPNNADVGAITADITDVTDVGGNCTVPSGDDLTIEPGETVDVGYSCTFGDKPAYEGLNTATATWQGNDGERSVSDVVDVDFVLDDEINRFVDVEDNKVTLADPETIGDDLDWFDGEQVIGYDLALGSPAGDCADWPNLAEIVETGQTADEEVTVCSEAALALDKTATASFDRTYHWDLDKVAGQPTEVEVIDGDTATFNYTVSAIPLVPEGGIYDDHGFGMSGTIDVTNPNTYEDGSITADVVDVPNVGAGVTCAVVDGQDVVIAPEETVTLDYACSFTGRPDYTGTNVATATWTGPGGGTRSASSDAEPVSFELDDEIDKEVLVVDDKTVPGQSIELGRATWNAEGIPRVFTYELTLTGTFGECEDFTNTATLELDASDDLNASSTVTLCVQEDAVLANIVNASFDRAYAWSIAKDADGTTFETGPDGTAEVNYTVDATPGASTDSGWEMEGSLLVQNPNAYKSLTVDVSTITDLGEGVDCVLDEGQNMVVPASGERTYTYTCTFEGQPAYEGTDTTTVTWDKGEVEIDTPVAFLLDAETDKVVDVVDDKTVPGNVVELGQAEWNAEGTPTTFTYALDLAAEANECETYTNTAAIVQTQQTDDATVEVCGPEILPEEEVRPRPAIKGVESLPSTGGPDQGFIWSGIGLLLAGCGLLLSTRRKTRADA